MRAARLGSEYAEDALRERLGVDFDAMWHRKPSADAYVSPAVRILRGRHNAHAPDSPWTPADCTMEDWALQRRALNCAEAGPRAGSAHIAHTELESATDEERIGHTIPDRKAREEGRLRERA